MADQDQIILKQMGPRDNLVQPFQVETLELRGRVVRLGSALDEILARHQYPDSVSHALAEALALTICLGNSMKYKGVFTLQMAGKGPLKLMVTDLTDEGHIRGYADFDPEAIAALEKKTKGRRPSVPVLFGEGYLSFTLDSELHKDRYQGIVDLTGETLTDCIHHYFHQSEQIETVIKCAAGYMPFTKGEKHWRAAALMLQRLPLSEKNLSAEQRDQMEEDWHRALVFMGSSTEEEMLSTELGVNGLLYRLFNEDGVRVYDALTIEDHCRCNQDRMESVVASLTASEVEEFMIDGELVIACEFCHKKRSYDHKKIEKLKARHHTEGDETS